MADVAVLGIGRMGSAMVARLAEAGHHVRIWNRTRDIADRLAAQLDPPGDGARIVVRATAAEAVKGAEIVLSVLASGDVTTTVLLDPVLLAALSPGTVVCDLATSGVEAARQLSAGLDAAGIAFVDAPVSGSVATVASGQLLVMAAGDEKAIATASPALLAFAKKVVRVGDPGSGQAMKLAVNLIVHDLNAAVSEGLNLATRAGIDPAAAYDVFADSAVAAPFVAYKRAAFLTDDAPVAMSLDLVAKDLRLIRELATALDVDVPATVTVSEQVQAACAAGLGDQDMAQLHRYLDR